MPSLFTAFKKINSSDRIIGFSAYNQKNLESEKMEFKLPVREAWTHINILVDKLSSLNEKFNALTTLLSEES